MHSTYLKDRMARLVLFCCQDFLVSMGYSGNYISLEGL